MRKILYLDLDGVLANFTKGVGRDFTGRNPPEMFEKGFFRNLELMPFAKEAVAELLTFKGLDVYIATKPTTRNLSSATEKYEWVAENFPSLLYKVFLTCDKGHLNGDFLIDDEPGTWGEKFKGEFLVFNEVEPELSWNRILEHLALYK
jgi:5'-nucleotidase